MQMYLDKTLSTRGSAHKLYGFYIGLREDSADILGANDLKARGYAFDCLNDPSAHRLERPFLGLIETPFLEQSGSVKRYVFN